FEHRLARHRRCVRAARRLRDDRERCRGEPAEILFRLLVVDVDELAELPLTAERREARLEVTDVAAGAPLEIDVLVRKAGMERLVDEETPYLLERDVPDEIFDVDTAIAEHAAVLVGLGDLGLESDDAGEAG